MGRLLRLSSGLAPFVWAQGRLRVSLGLALRPSSGQAGWIFLSFLSLFLGQAFVATPTLANPLLVREVLSRCAETYTQLRDYRGVVEQEIGYPSATSQREVISVLFR